MMKLYGDYNQHLKTSFPTSALSFIFILDFYFIENTVILRRKDMGQIKKRSFIQKEKLIIT